MPFSSGTFSLTATSVAPAVSGTTIDSSDFNTTMADIVSGLNTALLKDGSNAPSADIPMATYKHTNVGNAAARNQYSTAGQIQDGSLTFDATETGTGDAYEIVVSPAITAYTAGMRLSFIASEANTGASTFNANSVGAVAIKKINGADTVTGDILANQIVDVEYNGTNWILLSPAEPTAGTVLAGKVVTADANRNVSNINALTDSNGNEVIILEGVASAVNEVTVVNAATTVNPRVQSSGEANTGLIIADSNDNEVIIAESVASAVNEVTITNAATGNDPTIAATGGDTNIDLVLSGKGSGTVIASSATITTLTSTTVLGTNLKSSNQIGSYALCFYTTSNTALTIGSTYSGSNLAYTSLYFSGTTVECDISLTGNPSGTWYCLNGGDAVFAKYTAGYFVRIS